jgi:hypothetical protein
VTIRNGLGRISSLYGIIVFCRRTWIALNLSRGCPNRWAATWIISARTRLIRVLRSNSRGFHGWIAWNSYRPSSARASLGRRAADEAGVVHAFDGDTAIFITPGYRFRAVDGLVTNFICRDRACFMLVSALLGVEVMQAAYAHAIEQGYRFYSYGDASLLIPLRTVGVKA